MKEQRKNPRFRIMRPATVKIVAGAGTEIEAVAENAAIDGVLLVSEGALPVGTEVEITIFMPNALQTSCAGRVVRVIPGVTPERKVGLGVECTARPFAEPFRVAEKTM